MKKLIFTALLSLSLVSQEQNIFYKDADIKTFAQDIALLTDKTIILDPRVKGVISIYSDAPLDSESIWEVFISTMEVQGYNVLKDGNIYRVIPSQEGVKNFSEDGPLAGSIGSEVIKLRFSSAKDIVNAVKPIVGVRSYIVALQNDREVLIADDADNIKRVRDIIRNLDSELDTSISDFKLKNSGNLDIRVAGSYLYSNSRFDTTFNYNVGYTDLTKPIAVSSRDSKYKLTIPENGFDQSTYVVVGRNSYLNRQELMSDDVVSDIYSSGFTGMKLNTSAFLEFISV